MNDRAQDAMYGIFRAAENAVDRYQMWDAVVVQTGDLDRDELVRLVGGLAGFAVGAIEYARQQ